MSSGRYPKAQFKEEYCGLLIDHMRQGYSFRTFGAIVNIGHNKLYEWLKEFPEFQYAKDVAECHAQLHWEKVAVSGMSMETKMFNTSLWSLNMANRFGWRSQDKEKSKDQDPPPAEAPISTEDLLHLAKEARDNAKS